MARKPRMPASRMDEMAFVCGVMNLIVSVALLAKLPWLYWIWHCLKNAMLMLHRLVTWRKIKWHYFLWEYCYVVNYYTILYFAACLLLKHFPEQLPEALRQYRPLLAAWGEELFRVAFAFAMGPLALSVLAFRNGMVFHSISHLTILAVHLGPAFAAYGMRWYAAELEAAFPDTFHTAVDPAWPNEMAEWPRGLRAALVLRPALYYLVLWAVPYALTMFMFRADRIRERGYATMYSVYEEALSPVLDVLGPRLRPLVYMVLHASASGAALLLTPYLWTSYRLNTVFLATLVTISVYNAATYYFEVFAAKCWRAGRSAGIRELRDLLAAAPGPVDIAALSYGADDAEMHSRGLRGTKDARSLSLDEDGEIDDQPSAERLEAKKNN